MSEFLEEDVDVISTKLMDGRREIRLVHLPTGLSVADYVGEGDSSSRTRGRLMTELVRSVREKTSVGHRPSQHTEVATVLTPLDERTWLSAIEPGRLLDYLQTCSPFPERRLRLWACACARRVWHLLSDEWSRNAVELAEQLADGLLSVEKRDAAETAAREASNAILEAVEKARKSSPQHLHRLLAETSAADAAFYSVFRELAASRCADQAADAMLCINSSEGYASERAAQTELLRHIFGNPWRPLPVPAVWSATVLALAKVHHAGADVSIALHDALVDAGQAEYAEHFKEGFHPKGCAWLDAILGRYLEGCRT
jgi:hypothetical protein